ncbi:MAG: hypothetical protein LKH93_16875 [Clostridium beijerinckii]|jgi:hypothetical protein|nr:hypothetical protein [Clostridium beijerinckii]MCI1583793.1 hypothetical protein [Clostridium beijerinckii]MCI1623857.1 hypothetical protein [Clostridium beijerinckii]
MKSQLYLYEGLRKKYIRDLKQIKELFLDRIQPIFADAEKEATVYQNQLWDNIVNQPCYDEESIIDPSDFVEAVQDASLEKYELLSLMHYRNISMWISCMCQVWEQQLFSFIYHEALSEGFEYTKSDLKRGFALSKDIFEWHQQPFETLDCWPKIKELRALVNVIKHSEGESEQKLRKIRPDYFVQNIGIDNYDLLSLYHSTLLEATLQIKEKDFIDYYNALIGFWNELPERMYTKDEN